MPKVIIDLEDYGKDEIISINDLPYQITGGTCIRFQNHDKQFTEVYFKTPNGKIIGPCEDRCYLPVHNTGVPLFETPNGKKTDIIIAFLGKQTFSLSDNPKQMIYSLEHNIQQAVSFQYDYSISVQIRPDQVEPFINHILKKHKSSQEYIEKMVTTIFKPLDKIHVETNTSEKVPNTFSELSELVTEVCNQQIDIKDYLNEELKSENRYFSLEVDELIISCPQIEEIINRANTIPQTKSDVEVQTIHADIEREIRRKDGIVENEIEEGKARIRKEEEYAKTQLEIIKQKNVLIAEIIKALATLGMESSAILKFIQSIPETSIEELYNTYQEKKIHD